MYCPNGNYVSVYEIDVWIVEYIYQSKHFFLPNFIFNFINRTMFIIRFRYHCSEKYSYTMHERIFFKKNHALELECLILFGFYLFCAPFENWFCSFEIFIQPNLTTIWNHLCSHIEMLLKLHWDTHKRCYNIFFL